MKVEFSGSIKRIGTRIDASDNVVKTIILEVFGDMSRAEELLQRPLDITLESSEGLPVKEQ